MCGIAGLILPVDVPLAGIGLPDGRDLDKLSRGMLSLMRHRGPDGAGRIVGVPGFALEH